MGRRVGPWDGREVAGFAGTASHTPPLAPDPPHRDHAAMLRRRPSLARPLDAGLMRLVAFVRDAGALAVVIAVALGSGLWPALNADRLMELWYNRLPFDDRVTALKWGLGAAGVTLVGYVIVVLVARRRGRAGPRPSVTEVVAATNRRLLWGLGVPGLVFLAIRPVEKHHPHLVTVYAAVFAGLVAASVYAARVPARARWAAVNRFAPPALLAVAAGLVAAQLCDLALINHGSMRTQIADLGYYDNIFYQSVHGNLLGCSFMPGGNHYVGHFDPILVLLSPFYLISQRAETLLVLQVVWLAAGAAPAYLLMRDAVGSTWAGLAFGLTYLLYPALHGVALYEFHSISLLGPLAMTLMYALQQRRFGLYWLVLPLCLLVREDVPMVTALVGATILMSMPAHRRHGWLTLAASAAYLVLVKGLVMRSSDLLNCSDGGSCFAYYFEDMIKHRRGMGDIALSVLQNPGFAETRVLVKPEKLLFLLQLFVPLLGLPLLASAGRITMVFGLTFTMLATREPVHSIGFQYSTFIYPFAFALAPQALRTLSTGERWPWLPWDRRRLVRGLVAGMLVSSALLSWRFGALVDNTAFKAGFAAIRREVDVKATEHRAFVLEQLARVPVDAHLALTRRLGPQGSNRPNVYPWPQVRRYKIPRLDYLLARDGDLEGPERTHLRTSIRDGSLKLLAESAGIRLLQVVDPKFLGRKPAAQPRARTRRRPRKPADAMPPPRK